MNSSYRRSKIIGISVIMGSIAVLSIALFLLSIDIGSQREAIIKDRKDIGERSEAIQNLATLKKMAPEVDNYKKKMDSLLVKKDDLLDLSRWLDELSRINKIGLNFSFQGATIMPTETDPGSVGFSLEANGSYDNLEIFFDSAENKSPRFLVSFDNFDFSQGENGYKAKVQGRAYFR